ncbi:MAG: efflux RND transporter periplasmic adaptor subunit [Gammaproteobacteria bacterium]|nr:efflux RND transporter periplasmic adaptor subunit [Gammaproteobacteria bacterium]
MRLISLFILTFMLTHNIQAQPDSMAAPLDCLLEPNEEVDLSSQVPGILDIIQLERGDMVKAGQVVAKLKSGVEEAAVELAQAKVDFGKRKLVRNKELYTQNLISVHEKDEMETEQQIAVLELKEAREKLKLRTIRSPINGLIIERHHSAGEFVNENPILTMASIDPLNVEIIVPSSQIGMIKKGMTALVEPDFSMGATYKGVVDIVDPIIDAASGTFTVRATLPNPGNSISAGLKCRVQFSSPSIKSP